MTYKMMRLEYNSGNNPSGHLDVKADKRGAALT
jgi:hypothetical protein